MKGDNRIYPLHRALPPRRDRRLPRPPHGLQSPQRHQAVSGERQESLIKTTFPQPVLAWVGCALASVRGEGKDLFAVNE